MVAALAKLRGVQFGDDDRGTQEWCQRGENDEIAISSRAARGPGRTSDPALPLSDSARLVVCWRFSRLTVVGASLNAHSTAISERVSSCPEEHREPTKYKPEPVVASSKGNEGSGTLRLNRLTEGLDLRLESSGRVTEDAEHHAHCKIWSDVTFDLDRYAAAGRMPSKFDIAAIIQC